MRILGLPIPFTGERAKALNPVYSGERGGWVPIIREPFTGAWQRNVSIDNHAVQSFHADYACKTLIASDIAKLRVKYVEQDKDKIWFETDNSAYSPVLRRPNNYQNRIQFWENYILSKLSCGNTYVLKKRDARGVVNALYVLDPHRCRPLVSDDGAVFYQLDSDNLTGVEENTITVPAREIIHDRMNCIFHPLVGVPPIFASGRASQQGLNIQNNSIRLFKNASTPGGMLLAPGKLNEKQITEAKENWELHFGGANYGRIAVLGDGLKFEKMSFTAVEGQMIEQLKYTAEVVCSTYHVPPYKIGVGPLPSYNNVQSLNVEYYSQALQVLIESAELCLDEGLEIRTGAGTEFDLDGLLRMDSVTQITMLKEAIGAAIMSPDEARARLDLPPVEGGASPMAQQQNYSLAALAKRDAQADPFGTAAPQPAPADNGDDDDEEEKKSMSAIEIENFTKSNFGSAGVIPFGLLAYNPNQPRDPGGEGGGQWVGAGGGDDAAPDGVADPHKPVDPGKESALLTPEEQESITYYQGMIGFSKINNSLRAGNPPGEHAKRLSSAIAKHRLADEATVHRGIGNTLSKKLGDLWRDKEPGDAPITFVDKGFVSTSQSKKIAETYSKNTVTIKLPKGHNALPVVDRDFEHEAEILLDRGTKFKVTNMRETPTGWRRFDVEIMP